MSQSIKIRVKCYCSQCKTDSRPFRLVSRTTRAEHKKDDEVRAAKENMQEDLMEVDNEDDIDDYFADDADIDQDMNISNDAEEISEENSYAGFFNNGKFPKDPIAMNMFMMLVMLIQGNQVTNQALELMMRFLNISLEHTTSEYRFPSSASTFYSWSQLGEICHDGIKEYVSCEDCHAIYPFATAEEKARIIGKKCRAREDNLPFASRCGAELFDQVSLNPVRSFFYNSVINTLRKFFLREKFVKNISSWKNRTIVPGRLFDVYDGRIWKSFKLNPGDEEAFVESSRFNLMFSLNVDWLQLYTNSQYSCGAVYLTILNLPREIRNLRENVILVGLLPGPSEPSTFEINNYLNPLVDEFLLLQDGVLMKVRDEEDQLVKGALVLTSMDLPAQRKCLGFTGHNSTRACHKCDKSFPSLPGNANRRDFRDFDDANWVGRSASTHRVNASKWLTLSTKDQRSEFERNTGTRWSTLLRLPYFDPIRFAPVDVMHNCFLGTAKRVLHMIWRDEVRSVAGGRREESLLITKSDLAEMSEFAKSLILPFGYDGGNAVKRKITVGKDGFSHLTADEWRVWIIAMSPYLLPLRLNMQYYNHWMKFVEANRYIANTSITEEEIDYVHSLLKEFLSEFMEIYHDASYLSLNMHNHLHIKEGLLDYGPAMSHWLFNFERYNGDLKVINTNNKGSVENTITKRFLESVFAGDYFDCLPVVSDDQKNWKSIFCKNKRNDDEESEEEEEDNDMYDSKFDISLFLENEASGDGKLYGYECVPASIVKNVKAKARPSRMNDEDFGCLLDYYSNVYYGWTFVEDSGIPGLTNSVQGGIYTSRKIWKFSSIDIFANKYKSSGANPSRNHRYSYARIHCDLEPTLDTAHSSNLRPAQILYFFCHTIDLMDSNDDSWVPTTHTFAMVRWFKKKEGLNLHAYEINNMEVWSNEFEDPSAMSIVPVMRIHSPVAIKLDHLQGINVVINLPRHLIN